MPQQRNFNLIQSNKWNKSVSENGGRIRFAAQPPPSVQGRTLEYRLYGVIQDVVFTHQPHFSCSFLSLICLSTNQNIQLIHSLLIRIEWTTGNGILMSSSHWPIYNKFPPESITFLPKCKELNNYCNPESGDMISKGRHCSALSTIFIF